MTDHHTQSYDFYLSPGARQDIERLLAIAERRPKNGPERRLALVALNTVVAIKNGAASTHPLVFMPSYPDLSDCQTTYVGGDLNDKPTHRMVWREIAPTRPGGKPLREVIALGERAGGAAYHIAGNRLGRPLGVSLQQLRRAAEPIAQQNTHMRTASVPTSTARPELDLELC